MRVVIVVPLVAAICWYFGADVWHSILIASALTTVGVIVFGDTVNLELISTDWQRGNRPSRHGARTDIAELSWWLRGRHGRVNDRALTRIQQVARHRLALYQLDLRNPADHPKIEQLIGRRTCAILVQGDRRPPSLRVFIRCLDALEALDARRLSEPPSFRRRDSIFTPHRPRRAP
jgi:hypothetical protein